MDIAMYANMVMYYQCTIVSPCMWSLECVYMSEFMYLVMHVVGFTVRHARI